MTKESTLQECAARCDNNTQCEAFTYVTKAHENANYHGNCAMKTHNLQHKDLHQAVIGDISANKNCFGIFFVTRFIRYNLPFMGTFKLLLRKLCHTFSRYISTACRLDLFLF